jgi:uracil-DNA glycosylase family 4
VIRFKRTKCLCSQCPLNGKKKVHSLCGIDKPSMALLGEAPGANEEIQLEPFCGAAGATLKRMVANSALMFHALYRFNVILCRPDGNEIDTMEADEAIRCCRPGFLEELDYLVKLGIKVIIPLGNTALSALSINGKIGKERGSVLYDEKRKIVFLPTYHPSYIQRGNFDEEPTVVADLRKARELSLKKYIPPKEFFTLFPTVRDVELFVKRAIKNDELIGVDIETTGLNPAYARTVMIGLARNGEEALVVPWVKKGGGPYWSNADRAKVESLLKALFLHCRTLFQNGMFDIRHLEKDGYYIAKITHDTLLLHHDIHPELPHNLGYIVSIYGTTPFWKDVVLNKEDAIIAMEDETIRKYNARDSVVLHQILPGLLADLKDAGTERQYYEWSMALLRPLIDVTKYGIGIDLKKLEKYKRELNKNLNKVTEDIFETYNLPAEFNLSSNDQVGYLLYGTKPNSVKTAERKLAEYDAAGKRKNTKLYQAPLDKIAMMKKIKPLYKTKARVDNLDEEALISISRAAAGRLEEISELKRKTKEHETEEAEIRSLLQFIQWFNEYNETDKALTTFTKYPIAPDGRIHGEYKIWGTATGRLSAANPDMQNQTEDSFQVFYAGKGRCFVVADYKAIEVRVLAYLAGIKYLIDAFARGLDPHDVQCTALFGIDKKTADKATWELCRFVTKKYEFGRSYGGTVEGIYRRIVAAAPQMELTLKHFKEMDAQYFSFMPEYKVWMEERQKEAIETRTSVNAFGRKRLFLGKPDQIERQALNNPVQGTAGDICNAALIRIDERLKKKLKTLDARVVVTIHDDIIVECPIERKVEVALIMKDEMEAPVKINGIDRVFPVDLKFGQYLYPLEELELQESKVCRKEKLVTTKSPSPSMKAKRKIQNGKKTFTKTRSRKVKGL